RFRLLTLPQIIQQVGQVVAGIGQARAVLRLGWEVVDELLPDAQGLAKGRFRVPMLPEVMKGGAHVAEAHGQAVAVRRLSGEFRGEAGGERPRRFEILKGCLTLPPRLPHIPPASIRPTPRGLHRPGVALPPPPPPRKTD